MAATSGDADRRLMDCAGRVGLKWGHCSSPWNGVLDCEVIPAKAPFHESLPMRCET
jgi:hypothetical protein